jgi:DNA-binding NtrC family response regulator
MRSPIGSAAQSSVLVVDRSHSAVLARLRPRTDLKSLACPAYSRALTACIDTPPDLVIINVAADDTSPALAFVRDVKGLGRSIPIIFVVRDSSEDLAIAALNAGVDRYLREPLREDALTTSIDELVPRGTRANPASEAALSGGERLIGASAAVSALRLQIARAGRCSSNVLITGETGTGKELVAELIHENSARQRWPFVSLNSTAIPDTLLESELFGYERGAFTGAQHAHEGKLALGNSGTVFFDEIGDTSASVQAKLLRALDGKQIFRLGSNKPVPLDIRVLAATNQNLEEAVEAGRFRRDLFYRLNVIRVDLPPLRDRLEDIPLLAAHFIAVLNRTFRVAVRRMSHAAIDTMLAHDWPGNIRELKNVLEVAFVNLPNPAAEVAELPAHFGRRATYLERVSASERDRVIRTLAATNWNKTKTADRLHWSRMTLYRKLTRYGIATPGSGPPAGSGGSSSTS